VSIARVGWIEDVVVDVGDSDGGGGFRLLDSMII
jgi:hypothetical protein